MKWIEKKVSPPEFEQWKRDFQANYGRQPIYNDLKGDQKKSLKAVLIGEQGYICCYCMSRISIANSHIEHFVPRAESRRNPHSVLAVDNQLGYENLFLSCEGEKKDGKWDGKHCGRVKSSEGTAMLVSPTDPAVSTYFSYDIEGNIQGLSPAAMTTVRVLNLQDIALIRHRRKAIYAMLLREDEELEELLEECNSKDEDGLYTPFCEAISYVLRQI